MLLPCTECGKVIFLQAKAFPRCDAKNLHTPKAARAMQGCGAALMGLGCRIPIAALAVVVLSFAITFLFGC